MTAKAPNGRSTALEVANYFNADLSDKTAVVTGASSGIGLETCKVLASKGCRVVMCCRNKQAGLDAIEAEIKAPGLGGYTVLDPDLEVVALDLADLESVRDAARQILASESRIDFLVNNAGVMAPPLSYTKQGFELQMGTNHHGHFLLTAELLPLLKSQSAPARVVTVASIAHEQFGESLDVSDMHFRGGRTYAKWEAYGASKLANILFTRSLHKRFLAEPDAQLTAHAVHPGVISTKLWRHQRSALTWFVTTILARVGYASNEAKSIPQGAATTLYACLAPELQGLRGGAYLADCKVATPSAKALDISVAEELWEVTDKEIAAALEGKERVAAPS